MAWGRICKARISAYPQKRRLRRQRTVSSPDRNRSTALFRSNVPCAPSALVSNLRPLATRAPHAPRGPCRAGDIKPERPKVTGPSFGFAPITALQGVGGPEDHKAHVDEPLIPGSSDASSCAAAGSLETAASAFHLNNSLEPLPRHRADHLGDDVEGLLGTAAFPRHKPDGPKQTASPIGHQHNVACRVGHF